MFGEVRYGHLSDVICYSSCRKTEFNPHFLCIRQNAANVANWSIYHWHDQGLD